MSGQGQLRVFSREDHDFLKDAETKLAMLYQLGQDGVTKGIEERSFLAKEQLRKVWQKLPILKTWIEQATGNLRALKDTVDREDTLSLRVDDAFEKARETFDLLSQTGRAVNGWWNSLSRYEQNEHTDAVLFGVDGPNGDPDAEKIASWLRDVGI